MVKLTGAVTEQVTGEDDRDLYRDGSKGAGDKALNRREVIKSYAIHSLTFMPFACLHSLLLLTGHRTRSESGAPRNRQGRAIGCQRQKVSYCHLHAKNNYHVSLRLNIRDQSHVLSCRSGESPWQTIKQVPSIASQFASFPHPTRLVLGLSIYLDTRFNAQAAPHDFPTHSSIGRMGQAVSSQHDTR